MLSAPDWCFYRQREGVDPAAYYRGLRDAGITAVEMVAPERWQVARDAGLKLLNLSGPGMRQGLNRREHHPALIAEITSLIARAARESIPHIIVFSGENAGQPAIEGRAHCATALRVLAARAADAGVTLIFEMLNSFDHGDYQADGSGYGFSLAAEIASPGLKVLYDVYHMARMGEDVSRDISTHVDWIAHMHVADPRGRKVPLSDGVMRWRELHDRAAVCGYRGYWGLEFLPEGDALIEIRRAAAVFGAGQSSTRAPSAASAK